MKDLGGRAAYHVLLRFPKIWLRSLPLKHRLLRLIVLDTAEHRCVLSSIMNRKADILCLCESCG